VTAQTASPFSSSSSSQLQHGVKLASPFSSSSDDGSPLRRTASPFSPSSESSCAATCTPGHVGPYALSLTPDNPPTDVTLKLSPPRLRTCMDVPSPKKKQRISGKLSFSESPDTAASHVYPIEKVFKHDTFTTTIRYPSSLTAQLAWALTVGPKLPLSQRLICFEKVFGPPDSKSNRLLRRPGVNTKPWGANRCKLLTFETKDVDKQGSKRSVSKRRSFSDGVKIGQRRENERQSSAMQKTIALTSTTRSDVVKSLATYAKVVAAPPRRSNLPRRLGTLQNVSKILPSLLESSRFGKQAYPAVSDMAVAPLRGLKVFVGDTLAWSKQVFTVTNISMAELKLFVQTISPDPVIMFQLLCTLLGTQFDLSLLDAQVHYRRDETLFFRGCLASEGARDKMIEVFRNTVTSDARAQSWRIWDRHPQAFVTKVFSSVADGVTSLLAGSTYFNLMGQLSPSVVFVDLILLVWADNCQKITAVKMRLIDLSGNIFHSHLSSVESVLEIVGEEAHLPPWIPQVIASLQEAINCEYYNKGRYALARISCVFFVADHHCLNLLMCIPGSSSHERDTFGLTRQPYWSLYPFDGLSIFSVDSHGDNFGCVQAMVEALFQFLEEEQGRVNLLPSVDRVKALKLLPTAKKVQEGALHFANYTRGKYWSAPLWLYSETPVRNIRTVPPPMHNLFSCQVRAHS
jgi:hypothetical protein